MTRHLRCSIVSLVLIFTAADRLSAEDRRYPFQSLQLDNGLKVITLEDFSCPIVAVQVWYHVGSKDEQPGRQGFAHMFEHMMFRGTDRLNETAHFDNIRRVGGDNNAYTAFDQTVYVQEVPSNQLELVLWLESERMAFLKIDQKGFETERKVVEEELRQGHNRPYGRVPERLLAEVFKDQPYAWTPGGQIEHLRNSSIDELQAFWDRYYVPNNATLVIVGAVRHEDAQKLARTYFGWIPQCPAPPRVSIPEDRREGPITVTLPENKGPLPVEGFAFKTVPQDHSDYLPLQILMGVLGGGESSRLYVDIVKDRQIAQVAMAAAFSFEDAGLAAAGGILLPMGDKQELVKSLLRHIQTIVKDPISEAEFNKLKNQLRRQEVEGALSVASKASLLGQYAVLFGDAERINRRLAEIDAVTLDDVQRVARAYLRKARMFKVSIEPSATGVLGSLLGGEDESPESRPASPDPGAENRVAQRGGPKAAARRPEGFPTEPPIAAPLKEIPQPNVSDMTLSNGLKLVVVSNHEVPLVTMRLGIKSGAWTEVKPGTANFAMSMLTQGTTKHDAKQLAELLESHAIELSGSADMDTASVSGSALVEQLDLAAALLAEVITTPTFPEEEFNILKQQTQMGLMVSTQTPEYLADREFRRRLYGSHPYSRSVTGESDEVMRVTTADLRDWWKTHLRPDNAVLYLAGDINLQAGFALAEKHLAAWKAEGAMPTAQTAAIPKPSSRRIYLVDRPGSVQSQIRVGHTSITRRDGRYFASRVLSNIFGGGFNSRLNKAIRVEKGLTYGARGGINPSRFAGEFQVRTFTKTESTADTVRAILDEISLIRSTAPTVGELSDTQSFLVGSFPGDRETPEATVSDLWMIQTQDLPEDYLQQFLGGIRSATAEQVLEASQALIQPENLTIVVVGEADRIKGELEKIAPVTMAGEAESSSTQAPEGQASATGS